MSKSLFVLTSHCESRQKCHLCRDPEDRARFREALSEVYEMPGPGFFECPFGVTLENYVRPKASRPPRIRTAAFSVIARMLAHGVKHGWCRRLKRPQDRGAGDTIARWIHMFLGPVRWIGREDAVMRQGILASVYRAASGECASCGDIQGKLNERFPFSGGCGV